MNDKIKAILEKINEEQSPNLAKVDLKEIRVELGEIQTNSNPTVLEIDKEAELKTLTKEVVSSKNLKMVKKTVTTGGVGISEGFLANMVNETFSYEKRKYAFVEPRLFELLMQVKIKKDIKNISVIVNAILNEYVEKHQDEIKKILEHKF